MIDAFTNLFRRIQHLARPVKVTANSVESGTVSQLQVQLNQYEMRENVNAPQLFGFASAVPPGTDAVMLNFAGDNSNPTIIASNHQELRPRNMNPGECILYDASSPQQSIYVSQANGGTVIIKANSQIILQVGSATVTLTESSLVSSVDGVFSPNNISVEKHVHSGDDSHGDAFTTNPASANT